MEKSKSVGILLVVILLGSSIFAGSVMAQTAGKNNKSLKASINPVHLESWQIITPFGIYNVTRTTTIYKTPDGVTHMEGIRISNTQPNIIENQGISNGR